MNRGRGLAILVTLASLTSSCVIADFTRTGRTYSPLDKNAHVDVVMRGAPDYRTTKVGIVTVKGGSLSMQLDKAREVARRHGGNCLVLVESGTGLNVSDSGAQTYQIRTFEVHRKLQ